MDNGCYAHTAPDGKCVERTCIGIIALTRLHRCLVQVDDNRKTCHKEQEEYYPELTDANRIIDGF